jgi:hypothetical protein
VKMSRNIKERGKKDERREGRGMRGEREGG